jgi:prepilin peptidase CpaA
MNTFILLTIIILLSLSSIYDIKYRRIPNILTYPAGLTGLAYQTYTFGFEGLQFSIFGTFTGIGLLIIPYFLGIMGAGDAKLLGAIGSYIGAKGVFISFLFTALSGGIYALLILFLYNEKFKGFFTNFYYSVINLMVTREYVSFEDDEVSRQRPKLCYGLAIAAGTGIFIIFEIAGIKVLPL